MKHLLSFSWEMTNFTKVGGTKHFWTSHGGVRNIMWYPRRGYETILKIRRKITRPGMQGK